MVNKEASQKVALRSECVCSTDCVLPSTFRQRSATMIMFSKPHTYLEPRSLSDCAGGKKYHVKLRWSPRRSYRPWFSGQMMDFQVLQRCTNLHLELGLRSLGPRAGPRVSGLKAVFASKLQPAVLCSFEKTAGPRDHVHGIMGLIWPTGTLMFWKG